MSSADGWTGSLRGSEKHSLFSSHLCKDAERLRHNTRGVEPAPFWAFQTIYEIRHSELHVMVLEISDLMPCSVSVSGAKEIRDLLIFLTGKWEINKHASILQEEYVLQNQSALSISG